MVVKVLALVVAMVAPFMALFLHTRQQERVCASMPHVDRYEATSRLWILGCRGIAISTVFLCVCLGLICLTFTREGIWSFLVLYVYGWYLLTLVWPAIELARHKNDYVAFEGGTIEYRCGERFWKVDLALTRITKSWSGFVLRADNGKVFTIGKLSMVGFHGSDGLWTRLEELVTR